MGPVDRPVWSANQAGVAALPPPVSWHIHAENVLETKPRIAPQNDALFAHKSEPFKPYVWRDTARANWARVAVEGARPDPKAPTGQGGSTTTPTAPPKRRKAPKRAVSPGRSRPPASPVRARPDPIPTVKPTKDPEPAPVEVSEPPPPMIERPNNYSSSVRVVLTGDDLLHSLADLDSD